MPTYAYGCDSCGHRFDAFQRFSDDPLRECPECGAPIRRLIQPVGVVFKGSGWYITDSRPQPKDDATAKADGKSDDKTAAKPETPAKEGAAPAAKQETTKAAEPAKQAKAAAAAD